MNDRINNALFSLIEEIETSYIVKNLDECKKNMEENSEVRNLINDFNSKKISMDKDLQMSKINLYNNELVKKYLFYEQELNYIIIRLNKKISKITKEKGCM